MSDFKDLTDFVGNVAIYSYKDSKPLFENDRSKAQPFSFFGGTHFVVEWSRSSEDYDIQVVFPLTPNLNYNHYLILIYLWKGSQLLITGYKSHTVYPPVWDRAFSFGPDYDDYVKTQHYINEFLKREGLPELTIDTSYEGKVINTTKESPDEVRRLISEGKSYTVASFWAKAFFENSETIKIKVNPTGKND
jgi:hypothetical protein